MRWTVLSAVVLVASCVVDVDYDNTAFRCEQSRECPPGFECDGQVCRVGPISPDAAPSPDAMLPACPSADMDGEVTAFRAPGPISIDGILEAVWENARFVDFSNLARSDNTARVRLFYDDSNLYFAYEVTDTLLEAVSVPGEIFRDDGSEIYLDMAHDETTSENEDDVHYIANILDVVQSGTMEVAALTASGSYVIEHRLSWAEVGAAPTAGGTMSTAL